MGKPPKKKKQANYPDYVEKSAIFNKVVGYAVSSINDGYAYEYPHVFREELEQFMDPIIAEQIQAIQDMANMEREILVRDGKIIMLEAMRAQDMALTKIFQRIDDAIDTYKNNPEERELLAELDELNSMDITEDNAAEHNRRMREALKKAQSVLDPAERQYKLKKSLNETIFHVPGICNDEMIMPLRRMGKSRDQREAAFSDWMSRHYGM